MGAASVLSSNVRSSASQGVAKLCCNSTISTAAIGWIFPCELKHLSSDHCIGLEHFLLSSEAPLLVVAACLESDKSFSVPKAFSHHQLVSIHLKVSVFDRKHTVSILLQLSLDFDKACDHVYRVSQFLLPAPLSGFLSLTRNTEQSTIFSALP